MASFLTEGNVAVNAPGVHQIVDSRLPTGRYVWVAILLELAAAQRSLETLLPHSGINLQRLSEKLHCCRHELTGMLHVGIGVADNALNLFII